MSSEGSNTDPFRKYILPLILRRKVELKSAKDNGSFTHSEFVRDLELKEYHCAYAWRVVEQEVHDIRGVKEILGYEHEAFTTEFITSTRFIHPDDIKETMYLLKMALESEMTVPSGSLNLEYILTYRARKHNGDYIPLRSVISILDLCNDGKIRSNVIVATDLEQSREPYLIGLQVRNKFETIHEAKTLLPNKWHLTPREKDVLHLMIEGLSSKMIAVELGISKNTVDNFRKKLLKKTDSVNTADLVSKAIQEQWLGDAPSIS